MIIVYRSKRSYVYKKPSYRQLIQNDSTAWLKKYAQMKEALAIYDEQTKLKRGIYSLMPSKIIKTKDLKANHLKIWCKMTYL